jgi:hypothetical protein
MDAATASLPTPEDLRRHVLEVLCSHDQLDPKQTPLHQAVITRAGRPCGLFWQVQGPRRVCSYAVWAADEGRVLFYDPAGRRFAETRLSEGPGPRERTEVGGEPRRYLALRGRRATKTKR